MLYVSLVQIYSKKTYGNFYQDGTNGLDEQTSLMYSTFSFFGGCIIMMALDKFVDYLLKCSDDDRSDDNDNDNDNDNNDDRSNNNYIGHGQSGTTTDTRSNNNNNSSPSEQLVETTMTTTSGGGCNSSTSSGGGFVKGGGGGEPAVAGIIDGLAKNPGEEIDEMRNNFITKIKIEQEQNQEHNQQGQVVDIVDVETSSPSPPTDQQQQHPINNNNKKKLRSMGFAMALAIAIHNFPEGMASFLAYKADPALGVALAIGIALHNIPEGLCVSMPLYYATSKRWYSFWWGTLSGLSEPFGALFAWLILQSNNGLDGTTNGVLFGIVSGMMTVISIHELLPNAHKYARNPQTVTYSFLCGAFIIALSIMLFPPE